MLPASVAVELKLALLGLLRAGGAAVEGGIGGAYLEAVAAVGQAAIALRARARCKGTRVELAGESAAGLGGGEAEARAAGIAASRRGGRDGRVRRRSIHRPGIAGRRRVG